MKTISVIARGKVNAFGGSQVDAIDRTDGSD